MSSLQAWVGFLHVRPMVGPSETLGSEALGGYGTVLALASNADEYRTAVEREMASLGLTIIESERIAPLSQPATDEELAELNAALNERYPVQYRTFDTYTQDDA